MGTMTRLCLFAGAHGGATGAYQGFIALYLQAAGLNVRQVGMVMAAAPLACILAQPCWGALGDKARRKGWVLALMAGLSAALLLALPLGRGLGMAGLLAINTLFAACFTALQPMGDAQLLAALGRGKGFGQVKLWAGLAFALASLAGGYMARRGPGWALALAAALLGLTGVAALGLPERQKEKGTKKGGGWARGLKLPGFLPLLLPAAMAQMGLGYFYTFFPARFMDLPGGTTQRLGLCYLIGAVSEIPLLLYFDRLVERWSAGKLLAGGAFLLAVRMALLSLGGPLGLAIAGQALSGVGACVLTTGLAREIGRLTPPGLRARGQTLASAMSYALARAIGNLTGGRLTAGLGLEWGFGIASALCLTAALLFGWIGRGQPIGSPGKART